MMWFRRLVIALVTIAVVIPSVVIAPRYSYGNVNLDKLMTYDAARHVFIDKSFASDNWCRSGMAPLPSTGKLCREGIERSAVVLVIPQTSLYELAGRNADAFPMRRTVAKREITTVDLAKIAYAAADAMHRESAFARGGLAYDDRGKPADVFSDEAVQCDALGWILKKSCRVLHIREKHERQTAYRASVLLNERVLRCTGRSLVQINDEYGREAVVAVLRRVADKLMQV